MKSLTLFFQNNDLKTKILRGGVGSVLVQIISKIAGLLLSVVLARHLGVTDFGVYSYILALLHFLMTFGEFGTPAYLMKSSIISYHSRNWQELNQGIWGGIFTVLMFSFLISLSGSAFLFFFKNHEENSVYYLMFLLLPIYSLVRSMAHVVRGLDRIVLGQVFDMVLIPVLSLVLFLICIYLDILSVSVVLLLHLFAALVTLCLAMILIMKRARVKFELKKGFSQDVIYITKQSLPFLLISGAFIINTQTDILMIGWLMESSDVGIYRVAMQGAILVPFFMQALSSATAPYFSSLYSSNDYRRLKYLYYKTTFFILIGTCFVFGAFFVGGEYILDLVFGSEFKDALTPLLILAVGYFLNILCGPVGTMMQMIGEEKYTAKILWASSIFNIGLNYFFIASYGLIGAAIATSISGFLYHLALRLKLYSKLSF